MLKEFFQFKGTFRKKMLDLLLNKYYLDNSQFLLLATSRCQIDLFKELIYYYSIFKNDLDLQKLAKFYFDNKDYFFDCTQDKSLL